MTTYKPSPRPTFDGPAAIPHASVTRHVWGDAEAGEVADWIYASTDKIHCLVFGLPVNGAFTHSPEFLTVFGADEWLHVLEGVMAIANPETGEVERIPTGGSVFFRKDTWHHAFACDGQPLKVVEFFAPPPSAGTSGAYARTRPYLEPSRYADDALLGSLVPGEPRPRTLHPVRDGDLVWRRDLGALVGLACSTEHLTAGLLEVQAGEVATAHEHPGDEVLYVTDGVLHVRAWHGDETRVFELRRDDACFLPAGAGHEYRNYGAATARAVFAVAPRYA
jgi:quercetin dioxygenase-like cupin family protein